MKVWFVLLVALLGIVGMSGFLLNRDDFTMHEALDSLKAMENYTLVFESESHDGETVLYTQRVDGLFYYQKRDRGEPWFEMYVKDGENIHERFAPEDAWSQADATSDASEWFRTLVETYMQVDIDWSEGTHGDPYTLIEILYRDTFYSEYAYVETVRVRIEHQDITVIIEGTEESAFVRQAYTFKNIGKTIVGNPIGPAGE